MRVYSRLWPMIVLLGVVSLVGLALGGPSQAQTTYVVNSISDDGSPGTLRDAIVRANQTTGADTITFDLPAGSLIDLDGELEAIRDTLTIDGSTSTDVTILPPADGTRPLVINQGDVLIRDVTFARRGTAISHQSMGTLTLENVTFDTLGSGASSVSGVALDMGSSTVNLDGVTVRTLTAGSSAIRIGGDARIGTANDLVLEENVVSIAALVIDTTDVLPIELAGARFEGNRTAAQVRVDNGSLRMVNSLILGGTDQGLLVTGGVATLSFVTITENGGIGIDNRGAFNGRHIVSAGNAEEGCVNASTAVFTLTGRNFVNNASDPCADSTFPLTLSPGLSSVTGLPSPESPVIDRAEAACTTFDGDTVTTSLNGVARPQRANCDLGAFELPAAQIEGGELDLTTLGAPGRNGAGLLVEGGGAAPIQRINLDTFPIQPVSFTLTPDAECQLLDNTNTSQPSITLTFDETNWNASNNGGTLFSVEAIDDNDGEGNHECVITAEYVSTAPTDPLYEATNATQTFEVRIADDVADLTEAPTVVFNFCEIENNVTPSTNVVDCSTLAPPPTPELLEEVPDDNNSNGLRRVRITLENPPTEPVQVWITANNPTQCRSLVNEQPSTARLTVETWDEGVTIDVYARDNGSKEYAQRSCFVTGNWDYGSVPTMGDNTAQQTLFIAPDELTSLELDPTGSIDLEEGERGEVTLRTDYEINALAPDSYVVTLTDTVTGNLNTSECRLLNGTTGQPIPIEANGTALITLDASNSGEFNLEVLAIPDAEDGFESDPQSCQIQASVDDAASNRDTDGNSASFTVNIPRDPEIGTNAEVIAQDQETSEIYPVGDISVSLTEGDSNTLLLSLDRPVTDSVPIRIETSPRILDLPSGVSTEVPQCLIRTPGSGTGSNATVNLTGTDQIEVEYIAAEDPVINELNLCSVLVTRTDRGGSEGELVLNIVVAITENTGNRVSIIDFEEPAFTQNESTTGGEIFFVFPQPINSTGVIELTYAQPQYCRLLLPTSTGLSAVADGAELTVGATNSINNFFGPLSVEAFGVTEDQVCSVNVRFTTFPSGYENVTIPSIDTTILDVNSEPPPPPPPPPPDFPDNPILTPQQGEFRATATPQGTPVPEPIPTDIPLPSVSVEPGTGRLPVRTGPYLGATFVTIALPAGETGDPLFYRVLAKNNDERGDITWFKVVANGRVGWASGVTLQLNNITVEELPVEGSIFDQIEGAPGLGITGTLLKDRTVYRRPSTRAAPTGTTLPAGATVSIVGVTREFPYNDWYQIQLGGATGWIETDEQTLDDPAVDVNLDAVREIVPVR